MSIMRVFVDISLSFWNEILRVFAYLFADFTAEFLLSKIDPFLQVASTSFYREGIFL